jgi:polyisoprenoid-binding protein YceI
MRPRASGKRRGHLAAHKEETSMRRSIAALAFALAVVPSAPSRGRAATWELDPAHTSIAFSIRHMMISRVRGHFNGFTGKAVGDPAAPEKSAIEATIDAKSIDTDNQKRDDHLRSPDFLDVAKFPTLTFTSKKIEAAGPGKARVTGDLTLHGVTKEVVLDVEGPTDVIKDPMGNTRAGAHATTKINRKDFGIAFDKTMDGGGLLVGEEVDITIDVEAVKKGD